MASIITKSDFVGNAYFNLSNPNSTDLNGNIVKTAPDYYNLNLDYTYIINNNLNKFLQKVYMQQKQLLFIYFLFIPKNMR